MPLSQFGCFPPPQVLVGVLDAVGFDRPALVADGVAGAWAIHFSVTHPERVSALVLPNTFAHYVREDDYLCGLPRENLDRFIAGTKKRWGTAALVEAVAPSRMADVRFRAWFARATPFSGGPDLVADVLRASFEDDVRALLPAISVPTLVLHPAR